MTLHKLTRLLFSLTLTLGLFLLSALISLQDVHAEGPLPLDKTIIDSGFPNAHLVRTAKLNDDSYEDILAASKTAGIAWWQNNGDGTFVTTRNVITDNVWAADIYAIDFDVDGDIDVLGAVYPYSLVWWENDGDGNFTQHNITLTLDNIPQAIYAADLDDDDDVDVIGGTLVNASLWQNNGNGTFTTGDPINDPATSLKSIRIADLDDDDVPDVITSDYYGVRWWYQVYPGAPYFNPGGTFPNTGVGASVVDLQVLDLDQDAEVDIIGIKNNTLIWWENYGTGSFTTTTLISPFQATSVYATDLDVDGDVDVLGGHVLNAKVIWWENDGSETFPISYTVDSAYDANSVYAADLEGDGDVDLVGVAPVTWWENTTSQETDLLVEKTGPAQAVPGQAILYNLAVENIGSARAENVVITDTLPFSVTYLTHSAPVSPTLNGSTVTWNLGDINIGQRVTFALVGRVSETVTPGEMIRNEARVSALNADEEPGNNIITSTAIAIAPYSHTLSLTPGAITSRLGATETVRLRVANTGPLADAYTVTVAGLDPDWYTPITESFPLNPGASAITELELHIDNCSAVEGTTPFSVTVSSQESANQAVVTSSLTLLTAPQQLDLVPAGGSKTGSQSQLFSWRTNTPTTGTLTLYPTLTPTQIITRSMPLSPVHRVTVDNLTRNLEYSWFVESRSACGTVTTSPLQNFTVGNGLVFEQHTQAYDIYHDYGQLVTMTVHNEDGLIAHTLRVTVEHPYQDLIVGFVGAGSVDDGPQYLTLPPNASRVITLALHAQDAQQVDYDLTAKITANEGTANEIVDYAHLEVRVLKADDFTLSLVDENPDTLVKTYEVKNLGFPITDLNVQALDPATGLPARALVQPTLDHARLAKAGEPGDTIQFEVIPLFSPDDAIALEALSRMGHGPGLASPLPQVAMGVKVVTKVQNSSQQHQANYSCPVGQQLYAVTLHGVRTSYSNQDWYCTNRPSIDLNFATPGYINPLDILSARVSTGFNPAPGWHVLPHDVRLLMNDNPIGALLNQVPQGNYTFNVDPAFLNPATNPVQPVNQSLGLRTTHLNGGHYVVNTASLLELDVANLTRYVCATDPQQAKGKAGQGTQSINGLFTVSGQVRDEAQQPITSTTFILTTGATSSTTTSTTTIQPLIDATGRFTITDLISGVTSIITPVIPPPDFFLPETGQSIPVALDADPPERTVSGQTASADFTIRPTVIISVPISGVVIEEDIMTTITATVRDFYLVQPPAYPVTVTAIYRDKLINGVEYREDIGLGSAAPLNSVTSQFTATWTPTDTGAVTLVAIAAFPPDYHRPSLRAPVASPGVDISVGCPEGLLPLSHLGQAISETVRPPAMDKCGSAVEELIIIDSDGQHAFEKFALAIQEAKFEVNFTTMQWDTDFLPERAGGIFLNGIVELYKSVRDNTDSEKYLEGMTVRILMGERDFFPKELVLAELEKLQPGITQPDLGIGWRIEIRDYNPWFTRHSHVKTLIIDREVVFVTGYNNDDDYFPSNPEFGGDSDQVWRDMGVKLSGAIVQETLDMFDALWERCWDPVFHECNEPITHLPETTMPLTRGARLNIFPLYRDVSDDTAERAIYTAMAAATDEINILHDRVMYLPIIKPVNLPAFPDPLPPAMDVTDPELIPLYIQGMVEALEKGVPVRYIAGYNFPDDSEFYHNIVSYANLVRLYKHRNQGNSPVNLEARVLDYPVHAKTMSVDDQMLILGSLNYGFSSWTKGALYDLMSLSEYDVAIDDAQVTQEYNSYFEEKWNNETFPFELVSVAQGAIQDAVDQAPPHAVIILPEGVYQESVNIDKPLLIVGVNGEKTIIEPPTGQPAFTATSSGVILYHMTIRGSTDAAIKLIDVSSNSLTNIFIRKITFDNNAGGVLIEGLIPGSPVHYALENNSFIGGAYGVKINMLEEQASSSTIRNNLFFGQTTTPVKIISATDGGVEYSYNLFNNCAQAGSGGCPLEWYEGTLSPLSQVHHNLLNVEPGFNDEASGDYTLAVNSALIDAGDPATRNEMGLDGYIPRHADIGALETELFTGLWRNFFQEANGQVVMEAEHYTRQLQGSSFWNLPVELPSQSWQPDAQVAGHVGSGYLSAWPDTDLLFTTAYTVTSPQLNYTLNFTTTGSYTVWLRGYAPNGAGDSVYVALDDQAAVTLTGFAPRTWSWANGSDQGGPLTIEVTQPGLHTLSLWQREDGLRLDRLLLTTDSGYQPAGEGPAESERLD